MKKVLKNPTGMQVRNDKAGFGHFRAPRGGRSHAGEDYECVPGQDVMSPCDGTITKVGQVYEDDPQWKYIEVSHHGLYSVRLFYALAPRRYVGTRVDRGDVIGKAQDITIRYPGQGMTPHVHMGIILNKMAIYIYKGKTYLNPKLLGVIL